MNHRHSSSSSSSISSSTRTAVVDGFGSNVTCMGLSLLKEVEEEGGMMGLSGGDVDVAGY